MSRKFIYSFMHIIIKYLFQVLHRLFKKKFLIKKNI